MTDSELDDPSEVDSCDLDNVEVVVEEDLDGDNDEAD